MASSDKATMLQRRNRSSKSNKHVAANRGEPGGSGGEHPGSIVHLVGGGSKLVVDVSVDLDSADELVCAGLQFSAHEGRFSLTPRNTGRRRSRSVLAPVCHARAGRQLTGAVLELLSAGRAWPAPSRSLADPAVMSCRVRVRVLVRAAARFCVTVVLSTVCRQVENLPATHLD